MLLPQEGLLAGMYEGTIAPVTFQMAALATRVGPLVTALLSDEIDVVLQVVICLLCISLYVFVASPPCISPCISPCILSLW